MGGVAARDGERYLAELLHDEAIRSAALALPVQQQKDLDSRQVDAFVHGRMHDLGVLQDWEGVYERLPELSERRRTIVTAALKKLRHREIEWE